MDYQEFLKQKMVSHQASGFDVSRKDINQLLFDWQQVIVRWSLFQGCSALFEDCGLGKTFQELAWADLVHKHTNKDVLILVPLAVAKQTQREANKLGIETNICRKQSDVKKGINITNYEMIDHFDHNHFSGVVLDESSILKAFTGKTKVKLMNAFKSTKYRLAATATPSPNDLMELLNQADFLGIMPSNEALARWFINDTMSFGSYRLKGHAEADFWRWVQSWAVWINSPADIGFDGSAYVLPEIKTHEFLTGKKQSIFSDNEKISATTLYRELRATATERTDKAAEILNSSDESWIIWCNTNDESKLLSKKINGAVELTGSMKVTQKEDILERFANGDIKRLVSKASICGLGLNWQHINHQMSVGMNFSYEQKYQALKRIHRFGQKKEVQDYVVISPTEKHVLEIVKKKAENNSKFQRYMKADQSKYLDPKSYDLELRDFKGEVTLVLPKWL